MARKGLVPIPVAGTSDFEKDLVKKREFRLSRGKRGCDDGPFRIQPVQQFVSTFMSPLSPNRSLLLFHGTGVGKTCSAVQAAELQGGGKRRTLVLVPASIQGGFEDNVYNADKATPGKVSEWSKYQCTGSQYYSSDLESLMRANLRKTQRTKVRRSYEFLGHDKFANIVQGLEDRAKRDFSDLGQAAVDAETTSTLRSVYDNRLIIVDEVHELRSDTGTKTSYQKLMRVLRACGSCKLILMSATPMYNRAVEIVDIVNLMLANDGKPLLTAKAVFDGDDVMTPSGREALGEAMAGRVSAMTYEDPESFPALLWPETKPPANFPPSLTAEGKHIPVKKRLPSNGEFRLYMSPLSKTQAKTYARVRPPLMISMQFENVCYSAADATANEEAFFRAFRKVPGSGGRVFRYATDKRYLSAKEIDEYAPKIGAVARKVRSATGLCFVYSSFRWSGVFPIAIALEEMGFVPLKGRPLLQDAPGAGRPDAPRYVMITKDDESEDDMSVRDKVDAANDPGSGVKAVLGTETASQGLDFKRVREVHILEPWWNMSRGRQVIGRGIRRCSHVSLPEEQRNTTVYLHCTCDPGSDRETLDQRIYRDAIQKNETIKEVEALMSRAAVDCGMYEEARVAGEAEHVDSQGRRVAVDRRRSASTKCVMKWPGARGRTEASTVHPYVYKNMVDLMAFEVKDALGVRIAATYEELLEVTQADDLVLSLALTTLMNPLVAWRWLGDHALVYRGDLYVLVPVFMVDKPFTLVEARMGFLFSSNHSSRFTPSST